MRPPHVLRIKNAIAIAAMVSLVGLSTGCLSGLVYTHTTLPLDLNFDETETKPGHAGESWKTLVLPIYNIANLRFDWGSIALADAIERAKIETVHYADLETFSILGIWTRRTIHVYGE